MILVRNHHLSNAEHKEIKKLFNLFEGPFQILRIVSENTLVVAYKENDKELVVNVADVRPYYQSIASN